MRVFGVIPARGGSQRYPRKNVAIVGGKPLICWTIEAALEAAFHPGSLLHHIAVTTDDSDAMKIAFRYPNIQVIERPEHLSRGDQPMQLTVVRHALDEMEKKGLRINDNDAVLLLQPTSPLRTADDINLSLELLLESGGDSVISVTEFADEWALFRMGHARRLRPENHNNLLVPNGAIFLLKIGALRNEINWFSGVCYAYQMPRERSLDINTEVDIEVARAILGKKAA